MVVMMAGIRISKEIFAIGVLMSLKPSLKHDRKHVLRLLRLETRLKAWSHIVVTVAEYVCDDAPKMILKLSTDRLQVFLVKDPYM